MKLTKGEKLLYFSGVFCMISVVLLKIFFGVSVGNYKMSNEALRNEIHQKLEM